MRIVRRQPSIPNGEVSGAAILCAALAVGACNAALGIDDLRYDAPNATDGLFGAAGHGNEGGDAGHGASPGGGGAGAGAAGAGAGGGDGAFGGPAGAGGFGGSAAPVTVRFGERPTSDVGDVTEDTQLYSENPTLNYGGSDVLQTDTQPTHAILLRFDLGSIPPSRMVQKAVLRLWVRECTYCELSNGVVEARELLESWTEGSLDGVAAAANWYERVPELLWADPGASGDSVSSAIAGEFMPGVLGEEFALDVDTATVQGWVDFPYTNAGLRLMSTSPTGDGVAFHSSESDEADRRPELEVTYSP